MLHSTICSCWEASEDEHHYRCTAELQICGDRPTADAVRARVFVSTGIYRDCPRRAVAYLLPRCAAAERRAVGCTLGRALPCGGISCWFSAPAGRAGTFRAACRAPFVYLARVRNYTIPFWVSEHLWYYNVVLLLLVLAKFTLPVDPAPYLPQVQMRRLEYVVSVQVGLGLAFLPLACSGRSLYLRRCFLLLLNCCRLPRRAALLGRRRHRHAPSAIR